MALFTRPFAAAWLFLCTLACPQEIRTLEPPDASPRDASTTDAADSGSRPDVGEPLDAAPDGGFEADASCIQACGGRGCGRDPVCNLPCGECEADESCSSVGQCLPSCAPGDRICTDAFSYSACGYNPALGIFDRGPRVPCGADNSCVDGACAPSTCVNGEVMLLVDHSSILSFNSTWLWVKDGLVGAIGGLDRRSDFGLRLLPSAGCQVGAPLPPGPGAKAAIEAALVPPGNTPDRPIEAALRGLSANFGPPRDGQAVVLLTAGDESCGTQACAIREASMLFRAGVRTFVVGINNGADPSFLDNLALAGGTKSARSANSLETLTATLGAVFSELALCDNPHAQIGASYYHSCGLQVDGTLVCWGRDLEGESSPPSGTFTHLGVGNTHACAVRAGTGGVECWGRNDRGQLIAPGGTFQQVVGGDQHECGLRLDGTAECWGHNDSGQADAPAGLFKQLTGGGFFSCGVKPDDTVECWGSGVPTPSGPVRAISGGSFHLLAILADGSLWSSGATPPTGNDFIKVAAGSDHDCALRADGTAICWGSNFLGKTDVPPGTYADIDANYEHTCAVRQSDDAFLCWGSDSNGQASPP